MSKSSKRRNRLGAFLAVLSLATTAKNNFASAALSYNQNQSKAPRAISDIEWATLIDKYPDGAQSKIALNEWYNRLTELRRRIDMARNYANSFKAKMSEEHMGCPNVFKRLWDPAIVDQAADSIEQKTNAAYIAIKGYIDNIGVGDNGGLISLLGEFLKLTSNAFPGVYITEKMKTEYDNLGLNLIDLQASLEGTSDAVGDAKNSSGMERYSKYAAVLLKLESSRRLLQDANSKFDNIEAIMGQFADEIGSLTDKVEARNLAEERKKKEEQERIEKEAQEKLEQEKRKAEEQKQKALEEAKRNRDEAEKKFVDEKSRWMNEFAKISDRAGKEFEDMCKNSDPDIGDLLNKNQGDAVAGFRSDVETEIGILGDMKEYSEANLQIVVGMGARFLEIKEEKRKLDKSIKEYTGKLIRDKKKLENLRDEVIADVKKLKSDLGLAWDEEMAKLMSDEDKEKFVDVAKPSFESAKTIVDQMANDAGQAKVDLTRNSESELENLKNRMHDRAKKVVLAIDVIKKRGLGVRIDEVKIKINNALKERDGLWTEFRNKYEPSRLTVALRQETSKIWQNIEDLYKEEVEWSRSMNEILKLREIDETVATRLDDGMTELSSRLGAFKRALRNADGDMQERLDRVRASKYREEAYNRVYAPDGVVSTVRDIVGSASANKTPADSEEIARCIDSILPGTYNVALSCANAARLGGYAACLVSGAPGRGKTELGRALAAALKYDTLKVDYNKLLQGDGAQYAQKVIQLIDGSSKNYMIEFDEIDNVIRKPDKSQVRTQGVTQVNAFLNVIAAYMNGKNSKLKLVYGSSNLPKADLDSACVSRMTLCCVLNEVDFKRVVEGLFVSQPTPDSGSKEEAIERISELCYNLDAQGKEINPRVMKQAFASTMKEWCDNVNGSKVKGDPGYVEIYDAQVSSDVVSNKMIEMSV